mmetsp:Transcript_16682/g.21690  ORF Transcript_16682/g.21690 Transcript_16682/m.21690 type:complete len:412 (+) Transcript_16682:124-1359(+)
MLPRFSTILTILLWAALENTVNSFSLKHRWTALINSSAPTDIAKDLKDTVKNGSKTGRTRRDVLEKVACAMLGNVVMLTSHPIDVAAANADEEIGKVVRRKINEAVTQSDLGISVRKSVVRGAQVMDKVDGGWERLSDNFNLGTARSRREGRPLPKEMKDPLPLNTTLAKRFIQAADESFLEAAEVSSKDLDTMLERVDGLVRKSFERAANQTLGLDLSINDGKLYNYILYVHFRSYCDILIEEKINFAAFRKRFDVRLGDSLAATMRELLPIDNQQTTDLKLSLLNSLENIDYAITKYLEQGFVSGIERSKIDGEKIDDWASDLSDLQFSIALDGDISLNAQILLQEQGYRVVPDLARYFTIALLRNAFINCKINEEVSVEEYYMDTDYNSDPDKFEVKEVLLNVVIESS